MRPMRSNKCPATVKTTRTRTIDRAVTRRPFNFRLERVRALRERFEDQAREELAESLSVRLKGEAMLRAAGESYRLAQETRRESAALEVSGQDLLASQTYIERTSRLREEAEPPLHPRGARGRARPPPGRPRSTRAAPPGSRRRAAARCESAPRSAAARITAASRTASRPGC